MLDPLFNLPYDLLHQTNIDSLMLFGTSTAKATARYQLIDDLKRSKDVISSYPCNKLFLMPN